MTSSSPSAKVAPSIELQQGAMRFYERVVLTLVPVLVLAVAVRATISL